MTDDKRKAQTLEGRKQHEVFALVAQYTVAPALLMRACRLIFCT